MKAVYKFLTSSFIASFVACGGIQDPYTRDAVYGGLGGAFIGAGTGAIIGSMISNGDVGSSALLGTAIGLPAGAVAKVAYRSYKENKAINANNEKIEANYKLLKSRRNEIDRLREELIDESFRVNPDPRRKQEIYTGATIGTYH